MTMCVAPRGAASTVAVLLLASALAAASAASSPPKTSIGVAYGGYTYSTNVLFDYLALSQDTCQMYAAAGAKNISAFYDIFYNGRNAHDAKGKLISYSQLLNSTTRGYFYDMLFQGKHGVGGITGWQTPADLDVFLQDALRSGDFEQVSHALTYLVRGKIMTDQLDAAIRFSRRKQASLALNALDKAWAMFSGSPFASCANTGYFIQINAWSTAMTYAGFLGNSWYEYTFAQYFTAAAYAARTNNVTLVQAAISSFAAVWTNSGMAFIQSDFYSYDIALACNCTFMVNTVDLFHKCFLNNTIGMLRGLNVSAERLALYQAVIVPPQPPRQHYLEVLGVFTNITNSIPAMGVNLWGVPNATALKAQWASFAHGRACYTELPKCAAVPPFTLP